MVQEDIIEQVNRYLLNHTDFLKVKDKLNEDQLRIFVDRSIDELCKVQNVKISPEHKAILVRGLVSAIVSLGPLRPLMEDKSITEVMVNGHDDIYIQRHGHIEKTDIKFDDTKHLLHTIQKMLGLSKANKRLDESSPYADFSLPDGSRVNVILPPCSVIGPVVTIRKFKDDIATVDDLLSLQMLDKNIATLLLSAMKAKLNVIFCGSAGAGKTTTLNVFSRHIPTEERIITIEDTPELILLQDHVVSLTTKGANVEGKGEITSRDLFINSLRMRPDRIILGEVRGGEMLDLIQSISSGHSGSLAIVHAETPEDCFNRMVTMMLMTGIQLSTEEIRKQVARAVDLIVHVELFLDGVRRITYVTEVVYDEQSKKTTLHDVFHFKQREITSEGKIKGEWVMNKRKPKFMDKYEKRWVTLPEGFFEKN
jgi:pilus assembly protein CpaF